MELPGGRPTDVNDRTVVYLRSRAINCDLDLSVMSKLLDIKNRKKRKNLCLILHQSICKWLVPGICVLNENVLSGFDCDTMKYFRNISV